jgi:biotin carboxylase
MGLPGMGHEVALQFTKKHRMRRALAEAGLQSTRLQRAGSLAEATEAGRAIGYPVVVKPPDSQGSRGVRRVPAAEALAEAFDGAMSHSRSGWVIVEELLPGRELIVDGLSLDGEVTVLGVGEKLPYAHRPETARRITYPAALADGVRGALVTLNQRIVAALGLRNGITHAEFMATDGDVRLIEIAARGGGSGIYAHVLPFLTGVDLARVSIELALGRCPELAVSSQPRAANLHFFDFPEGRIERLEGLVEARRLPGVVDIVLTLDTGDRFEPPQDDTGRPGPAIVLGRSRDEVLDVSAEVDRLVSAVVA